MRPEQENQSDKMMSWRVGTTAWVVGPQGRGDLGCSINPRLWEKKGAHLLSWELTRESVEDPNAEAKSSLGRIWGVLGRALWWPSLVATWRPLLIMAEC